MKGLTLDMAAVLFFGIVFVGAVSLVAGYFSTGDLQFYCYAVGVVLVCGVGSLMGVTLILNLRPTRKELGVPKRFKLH